jgi:hypothetical protein
MPTEPAFGRTLMARWGRLGGAFALLCSLVACGLIPNPVADPLPEPGARRWIITVENMSAQPARLFVAEDESPMGRSVGTADPSTVPAGATQDVVFTVPPGQGWAIFVNPGPSLGPLILAQDVPPGVSGELPLTIGIGPDGSPYSSVPDLPGWFGN